MQTHVIAGPGGSCVLEGTDVAGPRQDEWPPIGMHLDASVMTDLAHKFSLAHEMSRYDSVW